MIGSRGGVEAIILVIFLLLIWGVIRSVRRLRGSRTDLESCN